MKGYTLGAWNSAIWVLIYNIGCEYLILAIRFELWQLAWILWICIIWPILFNIKIDMVRDLSGEIFKKKFDRLDEYSRNDLRFNFKPNCLLYLGTKILSFGMENMLLNWLNFVGFKMAKYHFHPVEIFFVCDSCLIRSKGFILV